MDITLGDSVSLVETLYESFGIKSIIGLINNEWVNIVTVIQFTRRKVNDLNSEYRFLEERLGNIDYDNFKVIFQARPIQDFRTVLTELQNGHLKIGEIQTKLLSKNPQEIANQKIGYPSNIFATGEYLEYNCSAATINMDKYPAQLLYDLKISPQSLGFRDFDEFARSWLNLGSFNSPINLSIFYPTYATISEVQYQSGSEIKVTLKIDQHFFDGSHIWITRASKDDYAPLLERKKYELASCENTLQDGFFYITLRHKFAALSLNDKISVNLSNGKRELLARKEDRILQFPSESCDPFLKAFLLFDAGKKMEEHLLNPKEAGDLVFGFAWLLEMTGISALQLGRDEIVREEKAVKGSADIIACYRESTGSTILAIDCTIGVPDGNKIDKIKNTADYLSRKTGSPVKAVIVTSEKSSTTKEIGQKNAVKIIDYTDIEKIIGFYKKHHYPPARQLIVGD
ncbi:MAG: hypothetical protein ACLQO7_01855 [Candidatus Bathyarchaeia archaeon]